MSWYSPRRGKSGQNVCKTNTYLPKWSVLLQISYLLIFFPNPSVSSNHYHHPKICFWSLNRPLVYFNIFTKKDKTRLWEGNITAKASFNCGPVFAPLNFSPLCLCSPSTSIHLKSSSIELSPLLRLKCLRRFSRTRSTSVSSLLSTRPLCPPPGWFWAFDKKRPD